MSLGRSTQQPVRRRAQALAHVTLGTALFVAASISHSAELFAGIGQARYEKCGGDGCWQQPPLPYEWRLKTAVTTLGLRSGNWETALHHLGRVSVHGIFVPDADYSPQIKTVREGARNWRGLAQQDTLGLSLRYAPRLAFGRMSISPAVGVLAYRQQLKVAIDWVDGQCCSTHFESVSSSATPFVGLQVAWRLTDRLRMGVGADAAWRVKTQDSPAGGGESSRPGLAMVSLFIGALL